MDHLHESTALRNREDSGFPKTLHSVTPCTGTAVSRDRNGLYSRPPSPVSSLYSSFDVSDLSTGVLQEKGRPRGRDFNCNNGRKRVKWGVEPYNRSFMT